MPAETTANSTTGSFVQISTPSAATHTLASSNELAINKDSNAEMKPTSALYASVLVALMLPFQFGWSLSQLNLSTFARQDDCDARPVVDGTCVMFPGHSKAEWTYVVNAWIVGGMIGSLTSGVLADKYGRRRILMASALFMIIGGTVQASTSTVSIFIIGRLLAGIASGCATGMAGSYVNEIAPPHLRGTLSGGLQIAISSGAMLVVCTFFFANTSAGWRYIAGFQILWGALFLGLASFLLVESPAWLLMTAKRDEAAAVMARIYGEENVSLAFTWFEPQVAPSDIESPRVESKARNSIEVVQKTQSTASQLVSSIFRRQLIIAICFASLQQLSGISAVFYYSSSIFRDAGISDDRVGSLIVNFMNFLPSFATGYLANRFGYRRLLIVGFVGMFVSSVGITIALIADVSSLSIVFTSTYVAFFAASLGPLIYVVLATLFPDSVRGTAVAICICFNWMSNLLTGVTFPYISDGLDDLAFLPFVVALAISVVFTLKMVPETFGKSSDEIQAEFSALREKQRVTRAPDTAQQ